VTPLTAAKKHGSTGSEDRQFRNVGSRHTTTVHVKQILQKPDATDRTAAVRTAMTRGIIRIV
jgi:hypothetical protein